MRTLATIFCLLATLVAPVVEKASVLLEPEAMLAGLAVKELMVGLFPAAESVTVAVATAVTTPPEATVQSVYVVVAVGVTMVEPLADSAARLQKNGIQFIELHGNHYGPDLGYKVAETKKILGDHGIKAGGICGMFSADNDLSSNRAVHRQAGSLISKQQPSSVFRTRTLPW